ncbi:EamA family transporter [Paenibacillus ginsengarvi]|uniref:EamA family transporter n=1 Tax=Paenibacillus ginsengarvi TaxID=400777 RepID=A0A3B0BEV5_9BACL|nr:EamA family transporter [Paenibacillus ginsengarvi]RKN70637.1 EamA family transporter [Paenibacillus ginsengarvi]
MKYKLSVLLGAACYGILSTIVTKAYGKGYTLGEVVGSQLTTGFLLAWALILYMEWKRRRAGTGVDAQNGSSTLPVKPAWRQRLILMAAGMPTAITGLLYYESLKYIPNSLAILLLFQFTWMGVLIHAIGQKRRPGGTILLTLAVLLGGTLLAAGVLEQGWSKFDWLGVLLGLASALSYTLFMLLSGKAVPSVHPAYRSAWMITGGMLLVFVLFPPSFLFSGALLNGLLPYGFMLGLFGAFLPPVLYAIGVPRIGEGLTGILGAVELPVAVLLASTVLHEAVSALQWIGVLLVLLGVALPEVLRRAGGGRPLTATGDGKGRKR